MASNAAAPLALLDSQRRVLETLSRSSTAQVRLVTWARVLLLAADGVSNVEIAEATGVSRPTVLAWRKAFTVDGLSWVGAPIASGRGRKPSIPEAKVAEIEKLVG